MAGRVNEQVIEQIRERTDIVDVIGSRVELRRTGSDYTACCPFHHERTPSFHVNPTRQTYKCFGCGEGGDVFSFLMRHDGMTFGDALKMLGDRCGIQVTLSRDDGSGARRRRLQEINAEASAFYMRCLRQMDEAKIARDYLASRELGDDIVKAFQIGYAPKAEDTLLRFGKVHGYSPAELVEAGLLSVSEKFGRTRYHDRFRGRLMFSICDAQGRVVAFSGRLLEKNDRVGKYVNSPETPIFQKSSILYALHKAQRAIANAPNRRAIICEGQIDTIRCHAAGFETAVASQGTAFTEEHVRILKRYADSVVLVFDRDAAGLKATKRTARLFLEAGVSVRAASLPEGEDPDSFIRTRGREAFAEVLDAAEDIIPYQYRLECAHEADPGAADASARIARELVETIAQCSNAVHRARMLQQAAELLSLPPSAIEDELAVADEARRKRDERNAQRAEASRDEEQREAIAGEIDDILVPDDAMPLPDTLPEDFGIEGAVAPSPSLLVPSAAARGLCEMLLQRVDNPEVGKFVATYAPEDLFDHPYCRAVAHAVYLMEETEGRSLEDVQSTEDAELTAFVGRLATAPERIGGETEEADESFTPRQVACDFIQGLWRNHLQREREGIVDRPEDTEEERLAKSRQRQLLTLDLPRLARWESAEPVILKRLRERTPDLENHHGT